jgi:mitochondrial enoyl-[acyl-carrier protein] reductase / trans-2-enoyl-CoA reductase
VGAEKAAPLFHAGGTALRMLRDFRALQIGDLVIQSVGSNNNGNAAVHFMVSQLAAAMGLKLISLVRRDTLSPEQFSDLVGHLTDQGTNSFAIALEDLLDANDGDLAMQYFQADLRYLSNRPPLLVLNAVDDGPSSAEILLKVLGPGGAMVTHGGMSPQPLDVSSADLIFKNIKIAGYWHSRWLAQQSTLEQRTIMVNELVNAVVDGRIECPPVKAFALSEFKEAFEFEANQAQEAVHSQVVFDCRLQKKIPDDDDAERKWPNKVDTAFTMYRS